MTEPSESSIIVPTPPGSRFVKAFQVPAGTTRVSSCSNRGCAVRRRPAHSRLRRVFMVRRGDFPAEWELPIRCCLNIKHLDVNGEVEAKRHKLDRRDQFP